MHTEHLQNVRFAAVVAGWLVAIAVTSIVVFVFEASGFGTGAGAANWVATLVAVSAGFGAGGFWAGFRTRRAPVLHGIGIGLASIVVWSVANVVGAALEQSYDAGLSPALTVAIVLVMITAAAVGALLGYNLVLRGRPGLSEEFPVDDAG